MSAGMDIQGQVVETETSRLQPWEGAATCDRVEFSVALLAGESGGFPYQNWPMRVQASIADKCKQWCVANPHRSVRYVSFAVPKLSESCVMILHHSEGT